ncbi:MAG: hypothetical protein JXR85_07725 [Deltaproteobacteria bacterium]|nr:hypothetical protein [Deltaproteobacteria bacterium]
MWSSGPTCNDEGRERCPGRDRGSLPDVVKGDSRKGTTARRRIALTAVAAAALLILWMGAVQGVFADIFQSDTSGSEGRYTSSDGGHDCAGQMQMNGGPMPRYSYEYFEHFIIPVENERGECRVLLCDIVLELNDGAVIGEDRHRIRKILFGTSRSAGRFSADIREMKKNFCIRIKDAVNESVGRDVVKAVQMTTFLLL